MKWLLDNGRVRDSASMILVGALWGCTNPLLRKGAVEVQPHQPTNASSLKVVLMTFLNLRVWLPYLLNQTGSIVFYVLLANSDLTLAVPTCNALAMLFSFMTSACFGEKIDKPFRAFAGATLVLVGVTICVSAQDQDIAEQEL